MKGPFISYLIAGILFLTLLLSSFVRFSAVYHFDLHSDTVIQILQAHDFSWKHDLYFWGQDRVGSFIPMLASFFSWLPFHPAWLVSVLHWVIGALAVWFITRDLPLWLRILFACSFLMPFPFFAWHLFVGQPYVPQLFFIGLSLFLLARFHKTAKGFRRSIFFGSSVMSWILSGWVSDVSLALFPFFLFFATRPLLTTTRDAGSLHFNLRIPFELGRRDVGFALAGTLMASVLILAGKLQSDEFDGTVYRALGLSSMGKGFLHVVGEVGRAFAFRVFNVLVSFHAWLLLISILLSFLARQRQEKSLFSSANLFLICALISFSLMFVSEWVALNEFQARYFVFPYYLLLLGIFFRLANAVPSLPRSISLVSITLAILISSIDSVIHFPVASTADKHLSFAEHRALTSKLDTAAVLGNYWYSYALSAGDPGKIIGTPHDHAFVRNYRRKDAAMKMKRIYLVKNDWLETFPDTITQFGRTLYRNGAPFSFEYIEMCEYR